MAASQINSNLMSRDEFSEHMRRLYEGIYTDFTIKCIGGALKCHKFVLASRIRFFKAKFAAKWKDKNSIICKSEFKKIFYWNSNYFQFLLTTCSICWNTCTQLNAVFPFQSLMMSADMLLNLKCTISLIY